MIYRAMGGDRYKPVENSFLPQYTMFGTAFRLLLTQNVNI